jgi:hypothetical protein
MRFVNVFRCVEGHVLEAFLRQFAGFAVLIASRIDRIQRGYFLGFRVVYMFVAGCFVAEVCV